MTKKNKTVIALTAVLAVLAAAAALLMLQNRGRQFVFVEDTAYPADAEYLDLRGTGISQQHYEALCGKLPECQVLWDVPFQGKTLPSDTESITVTTLSAEDVQQLGYFPNLREMDARDCRDYENIMLVLEKRPRCQVDYQVEIGGRLYGKQTREIDLSSGESSGQELLQRLAYLPELQKVHLDEPLIPAAELGKLLETYGKIAIDWDKTLFGSRHNSGEEFLDVSGMHFDHIVEVMKQAAYLPNLKQLDMLDSGFSNETMKTFRDQVRDHYKVVFNVRVGSMNLRTDIKDFFPDRDHGKVRPWQTYNLRYCEDLICVDVGHLGFKDLDWVAGTPHLKYLIMSDGAVQDLTPLGQLQELEFLELFMTGVVDTTPLLTCRSLRDLNLGVTPLGDLTPLTQMTWLEKLWVNRTPINAAEQKLLRESLPATYLEFEEYYPTWGGWRDMPRYFDMRDALRAPYMR